MDTRDKRLMQLIQGAQKEWGEKYLIVAVPGFVARKFVAYCSIKEDLELMLGYISVLRSETPKIVRSSLTYALIALYGKCFTDASENSAPKLEPKAIFTAEDTNLPVHNNLMQLRHNFIAHRGDTDSEIGIAFLAWPKEGNERSQVRFSQIKQISFSPDELAAIEKLLKFLLDTAVEKIQKTGQKVNDGMLNLFTPEQLALLTFNNSKLDDK